MRFIFLEMIMLLRLMLMKEGITVWVLDKLEVKCPRCKKPMYWEAYTTVRRPDVLSKRNGRAPLVWAWHCRCGIWLHDRRRIA